MLEGLLSLFDYLIGEVKRQRERNSLSIVIYHLLGDVANAAEHALTHYFPLTLREPFLQNSSLGTPYQKWAKFTNEDFQKVHQCINKVIPAGWQWYEQTHSSENQFAAVKDAWRWFYSVNTQYACCVVNLDKPELTLSAINITGWVDPDSGGFLNVWNRPPWDRPKVPPPIVTKSVHDINDRSAVIELQRVGLIHLEQLREANGRLAHWLRTNCTMEQIVAPHRGTLSDCWLG